MRYLVWTREEFGGMPNHWHEVLTELDDRGYVVREVAVNQAGELIYRAPSGKNERLLFDNQKVEADGPDDHLARERFISLWASEAEGESLGAWPWS